MSDAAQCKVELRGKVLVVAYFFPPVGGVAVQRTVKFVKYLPDKGWVPVILTVNLMASRLDDPDLLAEIPTSVAVHRTSALLIPGRVPWRLRQWITRWLLVVDEQLGWLPFAVDRGRRVIAQGEIRAIYTTSSPVTDHLIGLRLKQATGRPWIADFRDPWIGNFSLRFATGLHRRLALAMERTIVETADRVVVINPAFRDALLRRHARLPAEKVRVIPNGFDPADFAGADAADPDPSRMVIVHAGSFYGKISPLVFLKALRAVVDDGRIPADRICLRLVGNLAMSLQERIGAMGLSEVVRMVGFVPHRQAIAHMLASDALLLILPSGVGSDAVYSGKVFEYLAARKPILALVPPGIMADLVQEAAAGMVVDPDDAGAVGDWMVDLYRRWQQGGLAIQGRSDVIANYDRCRTAATLAGLLDEVAPCESA